MEGRRPMRTKAMLVLALFTGATWTAFAAESYGTAKEAEAMVKKAVAHVKAAGAQKAYQDFTNHAPGYIDRDLYVVVYDLEGRVLAHGQNPKMVGKELIDLLDPDGKAYVKERVELAKSKNSFWHDYKFTDPVSKKVLPKSTYCERLESTAVCVGIYKR
jgi:cytochrome c